MTTRALSREASGLSGKSLRFPRATRKRGGDRSWPGGRQVDGEGGGGGEGGEEGAGSTHSCVQPERGVLLAALSGGAVTPTAEGKEGQARARSGQHRRGGLTEPRPQRPQRCGGRPIRGRHVRAVPCHGKACRHLHAPRGTAGRQRSLDATLGTKCPMAAGTKPGRQVTVTTT